MKISKRVLELIEWTRIFDRRTDTDGQTDICRGEYNMSPPPLTGGTQFYSILFYPITLGGRRGTTDEFATIPFHLDLFSAALVELAKSIPVHSLILSSHLFFCLPLFLFPFTVPCRIVFAKPEDLETWPNHLSFRLKRLKRSHEDR